MKMTTKPSLPYWIHSMNKIMLMALVLSIAVIGCDKEDDENLISNSGLYLVEIDGNFEEIELDEAPKYLDGGQDGFTNAIFEAISYPPEARENGIEGLCVISYEITEEGLVENVKVIQDPGGGIGDSTIAIFKSVTEGISFSPGILNGIPVRVKKEFEITYKLE